jgi:hypothetical protein
MTPLGIMDLATSFGLGALVLVYAELEKALLLRKADR